MKKIGILTFHNAHNYGAMLQAYALQEVLSEENEINIINYKNSIICNQYRLFKPLRKNIIKYMKNLVNDIINYPINRRRFNSFYSFMINNFNLSKEYIDENELFKAKLNYDIMITGSDQVWNPGIVGELSDVYTLNFGEENIKRISYAASVGNAKSIEKNKNEFKRKISKIDYISVREEDAQKELKAILDKNVDVVLDPTLLLTKDEWNKKIQNFSSYQEKYILAYVVEKDEEYIKILNDLSEKTGLKVIHFSKNNTGYNNILKNAYTEGPLEFVNLIKNAEYVVCTSFHATVFSIIFNKKFFVVPHRKTGSRVTNILNKLNISNRAINSLEEFNKINYNEEIDYQIVNSILEDERQKSINWLNNAINN